MAKAWLSKITFESSKLGLIKALSHVLHVNKSSRSLVVSLKPSPAELEFGKCDYEAQDQTSALSTHVTASMSKVLPFQANLHRTSLKTLNK